MSTTLTPPDAPIHDSAPEAAPTAPRRGSSRTVSIIAICAGAVLIAGTVASGTIGIVRSAAVQEGTLTSSVVGVRAVEVNASAAEVSVGYGDVTEATLQVRSLSGADSWKIRRDGDRLLVDSRRDWWAGWGWLQSGDTAELTLPRSLEGTDTRAGVSGGTLTAEGRFGDLDLTLDAGSLRVNGSARSVRTEVSAGSADIDLSGVDGATFSVNAGSLRGTLRGTPPSAVSVEVNAGRIDLAVPRGTYALRSDVAAGDFSHDLTVDPNSPDRIDVNVSAGTVRMVPID